MKRLGEGEYVSFPAPAVQWEYFLHLVSELKSQIPRPQRRATSKLVRQLERDRARQERHIFEPALALGLPAWDVTTQPRTDYERGVRVLFECMLRRYCDRAEADADIADFARAPAQHSPAHYRWLAGYQYCGWSQKDDRRRGQQRPRGRCPRNSPSGRRAGTDFAASCEQRPKLDRGPNPHLPLPPVT